MAFQQLQLQLAAHLRDPHATAPPPGIEPRRLQIYRALLFNNIAGFLGQAFPVLQRVLGAMQWQELLHDFHARHRCDDPLFRGLAQEFLVYMDGERKAAPNDPPFLAELAHYEWVELALSIAEQPPAHSAIDADGDLLDGVPVVSPLAWTLAYDYPVHRVSASHTPAAAATWLIVYRNDDDAVKFIEINAPTARLMQLIEARPGSTGREHLQQIAGELGADASDITRVGETMLQGLRERGVVRVRSPH